jgi:hypothetical protein
MSHNRDNEIQGNSSFWRRDVSSEDQQSDVSTETFVDEESCEKKYDGWGNKL